MINPYFCYALSFIIALLTYSLKWSALYPPLSVALLSFLIITICIHFYLGYRLHQLKLTSFKPNTNVAGSPAILITVFLYFLWALDFLYEGGIPLFKILFNHPYNYREFGVPSLHVFTVTFASFYTIYLFHLFLSSNKKLILILFLINLLAAILIYSRAMLFFNLSACLFLFLSSKHKYLRTVIYSLPVILMLLLFVFGVLGTLRVSREAKVIYDNTLFLGIGKSTDKFNKSLIPSEYFWTYIYITSPIANLQHNINTTKNHKLTASDFAEMINNEIIMDFISKRINTLFNISRRAENTIPGPFNVSTVYSRSYSYLGWTGIIIMALFVVIIPLLYIKILPANSPFFRSGFAILSTMFLFLAYDNTIRLTGLSFQLVYPVLLHFTAAKFPTIRKFFVNNKVTT